MRLEQNYVECVSSANDMQHRHLARWDCWRRLFVVCIEHVGKGGALGGGCSGLGAAG